MNPATAFLARVFGAGAIVSALALGISASARACEVISKVQVTSGQISPRLDTRATAAEITERAESVRPGFADGITFVELGHTVELQPGQYEKGCRSIEVQVRLFASRADIYVARELAPDSCRWQAVMEHELRHLQISQRALDYGASMLRDELSRAKNKFSSRLSDFGSEGTLREFVSRATARALQVVSERSRAGDAALDTDLEARRMDALCGGPSMLSLQYRPSPTALRN